MLRKFCVLISIFFVCSGARADKIDLGVIIPLSGDLAIFGEKLKQGIELAFKDEKDKFNIIYEDGEFSNSKALSALHKILQTSKAKLIIGPFGPGQTFSLQPVAQKSGLVLLAVSLCDQRFANSENAFCIYPAPAVQLAPTQEYFRKMHAGEVQSIGSLTEEVGGMEDIRKAIAEYASALKVKKFKHEAFMSNTTDFRSLLLKFKDVDLLIISTMPGTGVSALRQLRELGIEPKFRWLYTEHDDSIFSAHKELLEGVYLPGGLTKFSPWFVEEFIKNYKTQPDLYHAIAYDAARSAIEVLEGNSNLSAAQLTSKLIELRLTKSACPDFRFAANHMVSFPLDVAVLEQGKLKVLESEAKSPG